MLFHKTITKNNRIVNCQRQLQNDRNRIRYAGNLLSLRQCGTIGAITAGKVIEVVGTTFGEEAWADIHRLVNKVKNEKYLF